MYLGGAWQNTTGTYYDTLLTFLGCDSVIVSSLTVYPTYGYDLYPEICDGDSILIDGQFRNQTGIYYESWQSVNGCDSIYAFHLTVHPVYGEVQTYDLCEGDSVYLAGAWQFNGGSYFDTLQSVHGCDSVINTLVALRPIYDDTFNATICDNDSIFLEGAWQNQAGTYTDMFASEFGCDSMVTIVLTVNPTAQTLVHDTICEGDSIYLGGAHQTTSGDYVDNYFTFLNCDSTVTTSLYVIPKLYSDEIISICEGDSLFVGGAWQTVSGSYVDTYTALTTGCDSLHTTNLDVIPILYSAETAEICDGDSIFVGGAWQSTAGDYSDVYTAATTGCDSVHTTTVVVNPVFNTSDAATICDGDSIWLGGAYQTTTGSYTDVFNSADGCDSTVVTALTVNTVDTAVIMPSPVSLMATATGGSASFQWINCSNGQPISGATNALFEPVDNGLYAVIVTQNGCVDTSECFAITEIGIGEGNLEVLELYPNPTQGVFYLKLSRDMDVVEVRLFNMLGQQVQYEMYENTSLIAIDINQLASGEYFVEVVSGEKKAILQIVKE
jgi:hypothetical protein